MKCCYCDQEFQRLAMRPYGPGGAMTCFPCATEGPARLEVTEAAMGAIMEASMALSPTGSVVIAADGLHPHSP